MSYILFYNNDTRFSAGRSTWATRRKVLQQYYIWFTLYRYNYNTRVIRSLEVAEEVIRGTPHCFRNDLAEARTRTNKNIILYYNILL